MFFYDYIKKKWYFIHILNMKRLKPVARFHLLSLSRLYYARLLFTEHQYEYSQALSQEKDERFEC